MLMNQDNLQLFAHHKGVDHLPTVVTQLVVV